MGSSQCRRGSPGRMASIGAPALAPPDTFGGVRGAVMRLTAWGAEFIVGVSPRNKIATRAPHAEVDR